MTATTESTVNVAGGVGRIARVTGPVVDVEFPPDAMPGIYNALSVEVTFGSGSGDGEPAARTLTLEVEQHLGDNMVRAVSLQPTDGLVRGAEVKDSGAPISVPVGRCHQGPRVEHLGRVAGRPSVVS